MKIPGIKTRMILVVIFVLGFNGHAKSQEGYPFMSHFSFTENLDHENFDLIQDNHNNILFANRKGILSFNSRSWDLLPMLYYPLCFEKSYTRDGIYIGCQNGYGFLQTDDKGKYKFQRLNDIDSTGEISSIGVTSEQTFFINQYRIFRVINKNNSPVKYWEFPFEYPVTGSFVLNNKFYFTVNKRGLYKAVRDTFELIASDNFVKELKIVFSARIEPAQVIIGTDRNRIYLFNGSDFIPIDLADYKYLDESILTDGVSLGPATIALSTLLGGVLICDYENGRTDQIINYNTGLPADEIFCLGTDNFNGLWLCHGFGVTRIDPWLSIRDFTWFPGLQGNLTRSAFFNGKLYIGTSDGVYILEEKKDYIEKILTEKTVSVPPPLPRDETISEMETPSPEPETQHPKKELKLFRRLKIRADKPKEQVVAANEALEKKAPNIIKSVTDKSKTVERDRTIRKKKIYSLQSISHSFTVISGIKGRCTELHIFDGHLLAGTNNGLYEIKDNKSIPVLPNHYIQFISSGSDHSAVFVGTGDSFFILSFQDGQWEVVRELDALGYTIYSASMTSPGTLWLGSDNAVYKLKLDDDFYIDEVSRLNMNTQFSDKVNVKLIDQSIYFFLSSGIYEIKNDTLHPVMSFNDLMTFPSYYLTNDQVAIYRSGEKWGVINEKFKIPDAYLNIFNSVQDISVASDGSIWIIANNKQIYKIKEKRYIPESDKFRVYYASLKGRENEFYPIQKPDVKYSRSSLKIDFSAPFYLAPGKTEFRHYIKGLSPEWSEWISASSIEYPLLPPGKYSVYVQARNIFGTVSEETVLDIHIKPPFYKTKLFYSLIILLTLVLFVLFLRMREKRHLRAKEILEQKVRERTAEIERQKNELAEQKKEITDSIYYARRIQAAVLPPTSGLKTYLSDHFVLFLPRDIVSGDFYWSTIKDKKVVLVAADCTGHGVPGAFMSMLGVSFLNELVNKLPLTHAGAILDALRSHVKNTLSQSGEIVQRDGMDIALCIIDKKAMKLQFSGANNPMYMIRNDQISEIKGDKMPIGKYEKTDNFTTHEIRLKKGDTFYLFSDGFIDQFGGPEGRKYLSKTFRGLLLRIYTRPMSHQKELLSAEFKSWKGNHSQVDDVLIIGFRM